MARGGAFEVAQFPLLLSVEVHLRQYEELLGWLCPALSRGCEVVMGQHGKHSTLAAEDLFREVLGLFTVCNWRAGLHCTGP